MILRSVIALHSLYPIMRIHGIMRIQSLSDNANTWALPDNAICHEMRDVGGREGSRKAHVLNLANSNAHTLYRNLTKTLNSLTPLNPTPYTLHPAPYSQRFLDS